MQPQEASVALKTSEATVFERRQPFAQLHERALSGLLGERVRSSRSSEAVNAALRAVLEAAEAIKAPGPAR